MTNGKDSHEGSSSSVLNVLQWVFLALAAGGVVLAVLSIGEPGHPGLAGGIGTVVVSLACFFVTRTQVRKNSQSPSTPPADTDTHG